MDLDVPGTEDELRDERPEWTTPVLFRVGVAETQGGTFSGSVESTGAFSCYPAVS